MNPQGKVKFQVWLLIAVVFALGVVTGGSMDRVYMARKPPNPPPQRAIRVVDRLKSDLNLNEEQVAKIKAIYDESRKEFPPSRFDECPGVKESRLRTRARIREALQPEQQKHYDEINAKRDAQMSKDH